MKTITSAYQFRCLGKSDAVLFVLELWENTVGLGLWQVGWLCFTLRELGKIQSDLKFGWLCSVFVSEFLRYRKCHCEISLRDLFSLNLQINFR